MMTSPDVVALSIATPLNVQITPDPIAAPSDADRMIPVR